MNEVTELLNAFITINPYYTKRETKNGIIFCTNSFVADYFCNMAYPAKDNLDIAFIEKYFRLKKLDSTIYNTNVKSLTLAKQLTGYTEVSSENWLVYKNISKLEKAFKRFSVPEYLKLEKVTAKNKDIFMKVNDQGFSGDEGDNPYANLDNLAYTKCLFKNYFSKQNNSLELFLIKYHNEYVGCVNLSYYNSICYISGLTILPKYRRTRVYVVLKDLLAHLIKKGITTMFCITEHGDYPDKLYKNMGFKVLFNGSVYKKENV